MPLRLTWPSGWSRGACRSAMPTLSWGRRCAEPSPAKARWVNSSLPIRSLALRRRRCSNRGVGDPPHHPRWRISGGGRRSDRAVPGPFGRVSRRSRRLSTLGNRDCFRATQPGLVASGVRSRIALGDASLRLDGLELALSAVLFDRISGETDCPVCLVRPATTAFVHRSARVRAIYRGTCT